MAFMNNINRFLKNHCGVALLEFALILPTLMTLFFGSIEISNLIFTSQKNQTAAVVTSNLVAAMDGLSQVDIDDVGKLGREVVKDYIIPNQYGMVVSLIQMTNNSTNPNGNHFPFVLYQQNFGNTGLVKTRFRFSNSEAPFVDAAYAQQNRIDIAALNGYVFSGTEQIIIAETAVQYNSIFPSTGENSFISGITTMKYETPPNIPRVSRFRFLPNGMINN